jgi:subtilase family serine protease
MFPTDLSAIDLDWGSNDAIEEFTVNFTYSYWTRATVTDQGQTAFNVTPPPATPFTI